MGTAIKHILLAYLLSACSSQSDFGAIQTTRANSSNLEENSEADENPNVISEEDSEEEEEITAIPPSVISGAYLSCVMDPEILEIGCQVKDYNDQLIDPNKLILNARLAGAGEDPAMESMSPELRANTHVFKLDAPPVDFKIIFILKSVEDEVQALTYEVSGEKMMENIGKPLIITEKLAQTTTAIQDTEPEQIPNDDLQSQVPEPELEQVQAQSLTFSNVSKSVGGNYRILLIQNEGNSASINRVLETTKLQDYIDELNADSILGLTLEIETVVQAQFDIESAKSAALAIWMDHSYQIGGLNDATVEIFTSLYESGVPLYFIGDDIAYSINQNLSPEKQSQFSQLCHLEASSVNGSSIVGIEINGPIHPIVDGPYGDVQNFSYNLDPDEEVMPIGEGEQVLATRTGGSTALIAYDGDQNNPPVVTQTFLLLGGVTNAPASLENRKSLFKNSLFWILEPLVEP
ncbi:MAG: hypothetical protein AB8G05_12000 [Oligoflexales bacterium]